jgi:HxlR-like helix-turn-helix
MALQMRIIATCDQVAKQSQSGRSRQQLKELEEDDLVRRLVYREVSPRVEYSLTSFGESLRPVLQGMEDWGRKQ